jgi:hypothetical protein
MHAVLATARTIRSHAARIGASAATITTTRTTTGTRWRMRLGVVD